jgi:hypothetical protein
MLPEGGHSLTRPGLDLLAMDFPKRLASIRHQGEMLVVLGEFAGVAAAGCW